MTLFDWLKLPSHLNVPSEVCRPLPPVASITSRPWLTMRQEGAVLRRDPGGIVHRGEPAGARLIEDDEARPAGNVFAHVAGQQPQIGVVAGAGGAVRRQRDRLAGEEILRDRRAAARGEQALRRRQRRRTMSHPRHDTCPVPRPTWSLPAKRTSHFTKPPSAAFRSASTDFGVARNAAMTACVSSPVIGSISEPPRLAPRPEIQGPSWWRRRRAAE